MSKVRLLGGPLDFNLDLLDLSPLDYDEYHAVTLLQQYYTGTLLQQYYTGKPREWNPLYGDPDPPNMKYLYTVLGKEFAEWYPSNPCHFVID